MKRNLLVISIVFILLVGACAPKGTPTTSAADIAASAQAAANTMVAQTQQAVPTNTLAPTETASPVPLPTEAATLAVPTLGTPETLAPGVTLPTALPTFTPQSPSSSGNNQDVCNQPLTTWQGPTAKLTIVNKTKPKGTIVLGIYVVTDLGQCGNLVITGDSFSGPVGQYNAGAFIDGKQHFKAFGSFHINPGSWKLVITNNTITAVGGCYPNC